MSPSEIMPRTGPGVLPDRQPQSSGWRCLVDEGSRGIRGSRAKPELADEQAARKESTSEEWRLRALRSIVAPFAALLVSLTLTAAASANVSFTKAWGWGVSDGASRFETCTSTCKAGRSGGGAGQLGYPEGVATDSSGDV
jgi:hypothetical protein